MKKNLSLRKASSLSTSMTISSGKFTQPMTRRQFGGSSTPIYPPSPDIEHLTEGEIKALKDVFVRMEVFEMEENERIRKLEQSVSKYEEMVKMETANKVDLLKQSDIRLCRLCFINRFADDIGRICVTCHRRVCRSCGSFSKMKGAGTGQATSAASRSKWRCNLCLMRRELVAASGLWFHGGLAHPVISSTSFKQRLHDNGGSSDPMIGMHLHNRTRWRNYSSTTATGVHSKYSSDAEMAPVGVNEVDAAAAGDDFYDKRICRKNSKKRNLLSSFQDIFNKAVSRVSDADDKTDKPMALPSFVRTPGRSSQDGDPAEVMGHYTDSGQYMTEGGEEGNYSKSMDGDKSPATLWKEASLEVPRRFSDGLFSSNGRPSRGRRGFTNYLTPYYSPYQSESPYRHHGNDSCMESCDCVEGSQNEFIGPAHSDDDAYHCRRGQEVKDFHRRRPHPPPPHRHLRPSRLSSSFNYVDNNNNNNNNHDNDDGDYNNMRNNGNNKKHRPRSVLPEDRSVDSRDWYYEEQYHHQHHQQQQRHKLSPQQQRPHRPSPSPYNNQQLDHHHYHHQHRHRPHQQYPVLDLPRQVRQRHLGNRQDYYHNYHSPNYPHSPQMISPSSHRPQTRPNPAHHPAHHPPHHPQHRSPQPPDNDRQRQKMVQQILSQSNLSQGYTEEEEEECNEEEEEYYEEGDTYDYDDYKGDIDYRQRHRESPRQNRKEMNKKSSHRAFDQQEEITEESELDHQNRHHREPIHWDSTCESDLTSPVQQHPQQHSQQHPQQHSQQHPQQQRPTKQQQPKFHLSYNLETRRQSVPIKMTHPEDFGVKRREFNTHPRSISVCSSPRNIPERSQQSAAGEGTSMSNAEPFRREKDSFDEEDTFNDDRKYFSVNQYYQDQSRYPHISPSVGRHQSQPQSPLQSQRRSTRHAIYSEDIYQQNNVPCMRSPITSSNMRPHLPSTTKSNEDQNSTNSKQQNRQSENSSRRSSFAGRQLHRDLSDIPDSETSQDVAEEKLPIKEDSDQQSALDSKPRRRSLAVQKSESIETEVEEFLRAKQQHQQRRESRSEESQARKISSSNPLTEGNKRTGSDKLTRSGSRRQSRQRKLSTAQDISKLIEDLDHVNILGHTPQPIRRRARQRFMSEPAVKPLLPRDDNPQTRLLEKISRSDKYFKVELKMDSSKGGYHGFGLRLAEKKFEGENKKEIIVSDVVDGGTADMQGINIGDQIVEWDGIQLQGKSLADIKSLLASCDKNLVQVIVKRPGKQENRKLHRTATANESKMEEIKQKLLTVLLEQEKSSNERKSGSGNNHQGDEAEVIRSIEGTVTLQVKYDAPAESLEIHIVRGNDLPKRTGYLAEKAGKLPKPYLKMSFLPRSNGRHSCRTRALLGTSNPEWNQKFTLDAVSEEELNSLTLQLSVWDDGGLDSDVFYGELLLPCDSVDITGITSLTLPLQDHDPDTGPMPTPSPKYLLVKSRRKNNTSGSTTATTNATGQNPDSVEGQSSDFKKDDGSRKGSTSIAGSSKDASSSGTTSKIEKITRRVSEFASKMKHDISSSSAAGHKSPSSKKKGFFKIMAKRRMSMPVEKQRSSSLTSVKGKKGN